MRHVHFSPGPFLENYEDGHPPEKESEEERRRYRSGLASKNDLEKIPTTASHFEEAFQEWMGRQDPQRDSSANKDAVFWKNHLRMKDEVIDDATIPASDYAYRTGKGFGRSKECFVIDIRDVPSCAVDAAKEDVTSGRLKLLDRWKSRSAESTENAADTSIRYSIHTFFKHVVLGGLVMGAILFVSNL